MNYILFGFALVWMAGWVATSLMLNFVDAVERRRLDRSEVAMIFFIWPYLAYRIMRGN